MLSKAAFNALLKTLEEPPEHVKFLLATTDPQKLPVTVLSRCLQFNLKRLEEPQIAGQIAKILGAEGIEADDGAIRQIAKAADGSLRDGLSLLDQAIAYAGGALRDEGVRTMLGTVDRTQVGAMLEALAEGDGERLLQVVAALADFSPDWDGVLEALAEALHRIQVRQLVPGAGQDGEGVDADRFASQLRPEVVQLWYQMALGGRRDLPLGAQAGPRDRFTKLTRAAHAWSSARPAAGEGKGEAVPTTRPAASTPAATANAAPARPEAAPARAVAEQATPVATSRPAAAPTPAPATDDDTPPWPVEAPRAASSAPAAIAPSQAMVPPPPAPAPVAATPPRAPVQDTHPTDRDFAFSSDIGITNAEVWMHFASNSELKGATRQLVENAAFVGYGSGVLQLSLDPGFDYLRSERSLRDLGEAIAQRYGTAPKIVFQAAPAGSETLRQRTDRERGEQQVAAEQDFMNHPDVQRLIQQHGAKVVPDSIRPFEE